jgi:hypothetical protein
MLTEAGDSGVKTPVGPMANCEIAPFALSVA